MVGPFALGMPRNVASAAASFASHTSSSVSVATTLCVRVIAVEPHAPKGARWCAERMLQAAISEGRSCAQPIWCVATSAANEHARPIERSVRLAASPSAAHVARVNFASATTYAAPASRARAMLETCAWHAAKQRSRDRPRIPVALEALARATHRLATRGCSKQARDDGRIAFPPRGHVKDVRSVRQQLRVRSLSKAAIGSYRGYLTTRPNRRPIDGPSHGLSGQRAVSGWCTST